MNLRKEREPVLMLVHPFQKNSPRARVARQNTAYWCQVRKELSGFVSTYVYQLYNSVALGSRVLLDTPILAGLAAVLHVCIV